MKNYYDFTGTKKKFVIIAKKIGTKFCHKKIRYKNRVNKIIYS